MALNVRVHSSTFSGFLSVGSVGEAGEEIVSLILDGIVNFMTRYGDISMRVSPATTCLMKPK